MSGTGQTIGGIRQRLVRARRAGEVALLDEVAEGLAELGRRGYRCCLVDYHSCRPAFYVRLLGFESPRVKAELEFPIEPHLDAVQLVPLSHLVDYDEAADPAAVRRIYVDMVEYLHHRSAPLSRASGPSSSGHLIPGGGAARSRGNGAGRADVRSRKRNHGGRPRQTERRRPARPRRPRTVRRVLLAAGMWWGIAGVLLSYGLLVFLVL